MSYWVIYIVDFEQRGYELHGSTNKQISFATNTVNVFSSPYAFLNILFSLLLCYKNTVYIIHIAYKICVDQLLSVRLPVNSRLLMLGESKVICEFSTEWDVSTPNPCTVQRSAVFSEFLDS